MQNIVTFETVALEPITLEPVAFSPNAAPMVQPTKPRSTAPWLRTLARKWDMLAVIALMIASTAYGLYALIYQTGF